MRGILKAVVHLCAPGFARTIGRKVVVIADETILHNGQVVGTAVRGDHLRVERAARTRYFVRSTGNLGWVDRRDVIELARAIDYFTAAIERQPNALDYNARGMVRLEQGEADLALADFDAAIRLDATLAAAYNGRGVAHKAKGRLDRALADYGEAIRLVPQYEKAYINRGVVWMAKGEIERALADYDEAIRLNPQFEAAYHDRGLAWKAKGEPQRAIADFSQAIRLDPNLAVAYHNRALARHAKGDFERGLADYDAAVRIDPSYTAAYGNRGCLWHAKGDYRRALADYTRAIELGADLFPTFNNRAWLRATCPHEKYRDAAKAIDDATRACRLSGWKVSWTLATLAAACALAGEFDKAIQWQLKAIELAPESEKENFRQRLRLYQDGKCCHDDATSWRGEAGAPQRASDQRGEGASTHDDLHRPGERDRFVVIDAGAGLLAASGDAPRAVPLGGSSLGLEIAIPDWWSRWPRIAWWVRRRRRNRPSPPRDTAAAASLAAGLPAATTRRPRAPERGGWLMKCSSCGKKHSAGFAFCQRCGAPLTGERHESAPSAGDAAEHGAGVVDLDAELQALVDDGQTEQAIRLYQEATGADWAHAERAVEQVRKQLALAQAAPQQQETNEPPANSNRLGCAGVATLALVALALAAAFF